MSTTSPWFGRLALIAAVLAICVVGLGAYTRLSNAGLGCPDWPGCYGKLVVPHDQNQANVAFPERPLEAQKAWKEMVHRYFAGTLGVLILWLAVLAWRHRQDPLQPVALPLFLVALVVFQALLGMWTVTELLMPLFVMAHLLGGMTTLALLWWLALRRGRLVTPGVDLAGLRPWVLLGLVVVVVQMALGGWTSANYAAVACPDFPTCQAQWWPPMDLGNGFTLWHGHGLNFEGGVLHNDARVAIHMMHRVGAVVTLCYIGWLGVAALRRGAGTAIRPLGAVVLTAVIAQVSLGIANVLLHLPLPVAVAHNLGAAVLLLSLVTLAHALTPLPGERM